MLDGDPCPERAAPWPPAMPVVERAKAASVNARFLLVIFDSVYVLALATWFGSLLFYSFGIAPVVSRIVVTDAGARLARALLPRFYTWGVISGSISLPAYLGVPLSYEEYRGPVVAVQAGLILAATLLMLYGANSLTPAFGAACAAGPEAAARVERLHRRSIGLNVVALALVAILLVSFANRPAPRTAGIVEPTPLERARAQYERLRRAPSSRPQSPSPAPGADGSAPR
jgi:hypothetical protein